MEFVKMRKSGFNAIRLAWILIILLTIIVRVTDGVVKFDAPDPSPDTVKAPEDSPPSPIYTVKAKTNTPDPVTEVPPTKMYYTLTSNPSDGKFQINSTSGVITHIPNPNFSFEDPASRQYVLTVTAFSGLFDGAGKLEEGTATINYIITDVDEPPTITNLPKCLNMYENQARETILKVAVEEPDGYNPPLNTGDYKYEIDKASKEPPGHSKFKIQERIGTPPASAYDYNHLRGEPLNYEAQNNYNMSIFVTDTKGKATLPGPSPNNAARDALKTRMHKVEVQVIDINEPPEFYETTSTCEVYENTPIRTTVSTGIYPFRAYDVDKLPGPDCLGKWPESVEYFVEGKFSELFRMDTVNVTEHKYQDGYLVVNKLIDREDPTNPKTGTFKLYVNARDSRGMRNINGKEVTVTCKILDVDDHPTICKDYKFDVELKENTAFDTKVLTVQCSDKDDTVTNPITYTIEYVGTEAAATLADQYFNFGASGTSSDMTTKQKLNLEGGTVMKFTVLATQGSAFSKTSTSISVEITVVGINDHRPTMDKEFYCFQIPYDSPNYFKIGNVSASDKDQPASPISYFLVEKAEGIMLGTKSGTLYVDHTNIEKPSLIEEKTIKKNHSYWMSVRAKDGDSPSYNSNHVYVRVDTYVKKKVLVNIEVAVGYDDFSDSQLTDFEKSISNICKPCKGMCPSKSRKVHNTVVTCYALEDDRICYKHNKMEPAAFMRQSELMDWLTSEKLVAGDIYGFGAYDIVSITPYDQGPDLLPLWIVLGLLLLAGLCAGLAFAIKACINHGLCKKKPAQQKPSQPKKHLHPESYDVNTFDFNYAAHDKGPI